MSVWSLPWLLCYLARLKVTIALKSGTYQIIAALLIVSFKKKVVSANPFRSRVKIPYIQ